LESLDRARRHLSRELGHRQKSGNTRAARDNPVAASCLARSGSPGPLTHPGTCALAGAPPSPLRPAVMQRECGRTRVARIGALLFSKRRGPSRPRFVNSRRRVAESACARPTPAHEMSERAGTTQPRQARSRHRVALAALVIPVLCRCPDSRVEWRRPRSRDFNQTKGPAKSELISCAGGGRAHPIFQPPPL